MSLFGKSKDINLFRVINRELINGVVDVAVDIYKANVDATSENLYGEAIRKIYKTAVRVSCLIELEDQSWASTDTIVNVSQNATFSFLRHELREYSNLVLEVGDIIHWNDIYWEIDGVIQNKILFGKDPDYDKSESDTGDNFAVVCNTHQTSRDRISIEKVRVGNQSRPRFI